VTVERVAAFASENLDLDHRPVRQPMWHMGAVICDAALQAGLSYRTVVEPRVERLIEHWPTASKVSVFAGKVDSFGLAEILRWRHEEKLSRARRLLDWLLAAQVETCGDLAAVLVQQVTVEDLLKLHGVGPKTVDYLGVLVGVPTVAVDRHHRTFLLWAGVPVGGYLETRNLLLDVAAELRVEPRVYDEAVWAFVTTSGLKGPRRPAAQPGSGS
jgi:hypothetical protein